MLLSVSAEILLAACMFFGAALYSSVGHGGASAYIALMAIFGVAPGIMRPTALMLNIIVTVFTSWRYFNAGMFRWRTLWPFLLGAVPFAFLGGGVQVPGHIYRPMLGVVLLLSATRMLWPQELKPPRPWRDPPVLAGILCGGLIGLLSGLTGTGGGIFLSPLLIFLAWSEPKPASGAVALFILCNSAAGLLGNLASVQSLPPDLPLFAGAVLAGALAGTTLGIRLATPLILRALGVVLIIAGLKLIGLY
ncbi:MAG: sulfite exporter TauE/SafE family protein [Beijerinckiaceae bacterium]